MKRQNLNTNYRGQSANRSRGRMRPIRNYSAYRGGVESRWLRRGLWALGVLAAAGLVCFIALLAVVRLGDRDEIRGEPGVMIILGCQVKPWGPSVLLQDRLDKAMEYLSEHPDTVVVCSGGQGADEPMSEAACMRDWLVEQGFPEENILLEEQSLNTIQNLEYSFIVLRESDYRDRMGKVMVVSNGFHLARVRMLFGRVWQGTYTLSTLAAPSSHVPSRIKMYLREPLALVKSYLFDRGEPSRMTS